MTKVQRHTLQLLLIPLLKVGIPLRRDFENGTTFRILMTAAHNGAFMEFCKPVPTKEECPWARGKENADKMWALSEELVGEKFSYDA